MIRKEANSQSNDSSFIYLTHIRFIAIFVLFFLGAAVVYHGILDFLGFNYPWNTFLFDPSDRFNDWVNSVNQAHSSNPYYAQGPALATYFPFSYVMFGFLGRDSISGVTVYFLVTLLLMLTLGFCMQYSKYLIEKIPNASFRSRLIFLLLVVSLFTYPVIFSLDRGNIDLWISLLCSIFVFLTNSKLDYLGSLALAIAISLKGYPAAFLLLLLMERKYYNVFFIMLMTAFLTMYPLLFMWDSLNFNLQGFLTNFKKYKEIYVLGNGSLFASSDPYNAIRLVFFKFLEFSNNLDESHIRNASLYVYNYYKYLIFAFACLVSFYVVMLRDCQWKKILAICLLTILFPNVANDYKLNMLLPAMYFLVFHDMNKSESRKIFLAVCLLMVPKSYFFVSGRSISMLINPIILGYLSFLILSQQSVKLQFKNYLNFIFKK